MRLKGRAGRIALEGEAVTEALIEEIVAWLGDRRRGRSGGTGSDKDI
jgi:hypothetical protein